MNRHDLLIKTRSTFPRLSLPPFVVTAARSRLSAGLVSYACWSCSFVKGRCYNLCDLPSRCLLWQSRDRKKCLEYFWQKKKSEVQERIQRRMLVCFTTERRKTNHTLQCPHPQSKITFIRTQGFYKSPSPFFWKFIAKQPSKFLSREKKVFSNTH